MIKLVVDSPRVCIVLYSCPYFLNSTFTTQFYLVFSARKWQVVRENQFELISFLYVPIQTIKDTLIRCFTQFCYSEPDFVKMSSRPEWPPFLHNLCYLHGALRLKARFGRAGWNKPQDFLSLTFTELFVSEILSLVPKYLNVSTSIKQTVYQEI